MKISVIDDVTGERIVRDMNEQELNQLELDRASKEKRVADEQLKALEKAALLEKLGITADEAALLLA